MRRLALPVLLLLLGGCVWALEPLQLARSGPPIELRTAEAPRLLQPGERVGLVMLGSPAPGPELRDCVLRGLGAGLPAGTPPRLPEADVAARLAAMAEAATSDSDLPDAAAGFGLDWLVALRDRSEVSPEEESSEGFGGSGGIGVALTRDQRYRLELEAVLLDLRQRHHWGVITARVETRSRGGLLLGIFGGGGAAAPLILPLIVLPAGTSAMAICEATGKAIGQALLHGKPGTPPAAPPR